jgi:uncharacterized protein (DUF486 family)
MRTVVLLIISNVFMPLSVFYMGSSINWNYLWAGC